MLVSVIITTYNSEKFIIRALESVLLQSYENFEILVVDDCSTDETINILQKYKEKISIIKKKNNSGPANSRNLGIKQSKGDLICFLDADDYWMQDKLKKQVAYAKAYPEIGIFSNNIYSVSQEKILSKRFNHIKIFQPKKIRHGVVENYLRSTGRYSFHPPSIIMVRRKLFIEHGMFDEKFISVEDSELILRWILKGVKIYYNDEVLGCYEISNNQSLTKNFELWCKNHFSYWYNFNLKNFETKKKKLFIKMRKKTLLDSLYVLIKKDNLKLSKFYLFKFKKDLFSFKWMFLVILCFLPINFFLKIRNYVKSTNYFF